VKEVGVRLAGELPEIQISAYDPRQRNLPVPYVPKEAREVPHVVRDPSAALVPIGKLINDDLMDFRGDTTDKVQGIGAKALVQQQVGEASDSDFEWVEREHSNAVSARWIFQTAVRRQFPLALQVIPSDHPKFDAMVELSSPADTHIRKPPMRPCGSIWRMSC